MRRFFKWFGVLVAAAATVSYLTLGGPLTLLFVIKLLGIPPTFFSQLFPYVYYDHVEARLEIDGEQVVVHGTARCSIATGYILDSSPKRTTTTLTGGAAVSTMSDGRAVVIPYSDGDYCQTPGTVGKMSDSPLGIYRDWNKVFDQRFPLNGNIDILIMNDGNNPTELEVIDGPGYFRNGDASIKLISADRWRSKLGSSTTSHLGWFNRDEASIDPKKWVGAFVWVLSSEFYVEDARYKPFRDYLMDDPHSKLRSFSGWISLIENNSGLLAWPADLSHETVSWSARGEPFRIPLSVRSERWYPDEQSVTRPGGCSHVSSPNYWSVQGAREFYENGTKRSIIPFSSRIGEGTAFYFDYISQDIIIGNKFCVAPQS